MGRERLSQVEFAEALQEWGSGLLSAIATPLPERTQAASTSRPQPLKPASPAIERQPSKRPVAEPVNAGKERRPHSVVKYPHTVARPGVR